MPELPEVQTIVDDLNQSIKGETILQLESGFKKAIKGMSLNKINKSIANAKIEDVKRIAKNIVFKLSNGHSLIFHLKMTGQLIASDKKRDDKHLHHCLRLKNKYICFYDIRKFGTISLFKNSDLNKKFENIGIDPVSKELTQEFLENAIQSNSKKNIKSFLMNQNIISGIGNIYASEILFNALINPSKKVMELSQSEIKRLHTSINFILKKAIKMRGTSVSDYRDAAGKKGKFQKELKVYKKNGQKCPNCDTILEKCIIEQRSTFFCPNCQK